MQVFTGFLSARAVAVLFLISTISGCALSKASDSEAIDSKALDPEFAAFRALQASPLSDGQALSAEQRAALLDEVGRNWLYGQGMGDTILNIGAAIAFPPYILALLGNGALSLAGYEPVSIAQVMPREARASYEEVRDSVTGAPGQAAAAIAGEKFRTHSMANHAINSAMLHPDEEVQFR